MYDLNSIHVFCADRLREGAVPRLLSAKGAVKAYMRGYPPLSLGFDLLGCVKNKCCFLKSEPLVAWVRQLRGAMPGFPSKSTEWAMENDWFKAVLSLSPSPGSRSRRLGTGCSPPPEPGKPSSPTWGGLVCLSTPRVGRGRPRGISLEPRRYPSRWLRSCRRCLASGVVQWVPRRPILPYDLRPFSSSGNRGQWV